MRYLFVDFTLPYLIKDSEYPVGGWAVELQTWIKGLTANGVNCGVLTWKGAHEYAGKNLDFEFLDTYDPNKGIKIAKYFYSYIPAMLNAARKFQPDVIIQACCGLNTGIMGYIATRLDVPFVYRVASDLDTDKRYRNYLRGYEQIAYRYGLKRASAMICQNNYQYASLQKWYPDTPMHILHNPYDTSRAVSQPLPRSAKKYIAWLGVFKKEKNMELLLSVAKKSPDILFKIGGKVSGSTDRGTLHTVDQLKMLPNVEFVGYITRNNIIDFLSGAIALMNTSFAEGFSNTYLEALSAGTPIVAPLRVDPDHIITKNKLGLTTDRDDKLADKVAEICKMSEPDYHQLSHDCRNYLLTNHDPHRKAIELEKILSKIIAT